MTRLLREHPSIDVELDGDGRLIAVRWAGRRESVEVCNRWRIDEAGGATRSPGTTSRSSARAGWRSSISIGSTGPGISSGSTYCPAARPVRSVSAARVDRSPGSRRTGSPGCPRRESVPPDPAAERTARWLPLSDPTAGGPVRSGAAECRCDGRVVPSRRVPEGATPTGGCERRRCRGPVATRRGPWGRPPAHQADDRVVGSTASRPTPLPWCTPPGMQPSGDNAETPSGHRVFRRTSRDLGTAQKGWRNPSGAVFQVPPFDWNWTFSV